MALLETAVGALRGAARPPGPLRNEILSWVVPRRRVTWRGSAAGARVAMTFDDGPDPARTPALLDVLARHGVRATFFLVGERVEAEPALARAVVAAGHEVGNHSHTHNAGQVAPLADPEREIDRANDAIARATGVRPTLFRPPYGALDLEVLLRCGIAGMTVAMWSYDTRDFEGPDPAALALGMSRLRGGDVVLMHDNADAATAIVDEFVPRLRARGLDFARLSELIAQ